LAYRLVLVSGGTPLACLIASEPVLVHEPLSCYLLAHELLHHLEFSENVYDTSRY